jgi:hypothetical protein
MNNLKVQNIYNSHVMHYGLLFMLVSALVMFVKTISYENAKLIFSIVEITFAALHAVYFIVAIWTMKFKNILIYNLTVSVNLALLIVDIHFENINFLFYVALVSLIGAFLIANLIVFNKTKGKPL